MRPVGAQSVSPMGREAPCPWPLGPQRTEWLRARTSEDTAGRRINIDPDYTAVLHELRGEVYSRDEGDLLLAPAPELQLQQLAEGLPHRHIDRNGIVQLERAGLIVQGPA